jgi:glycosyltransferase involved in cell wall biosynthesis
MNDPRQHRIDIAYVSSAHPYSDNRVHLREAASTAAAGYRTALIAVDTPVDVPVTGVEVHRIRRRSRLARVTLGSWKAVRLALRLRPRAVHLHDPELVWSIPVFRMRGIRVIWDAHEDLPDQVLDKHYLSRRQSRALAVLARLVVRIASSSSAVITATERIAERFPRARTTVVHNYPRLRAEDSRAALILERPLRVGYIGALGALRGSDVLAGAIAHPAFPPGWSLHVAGTFVPLTVGAAFEAQVPSGRVVLHGQLAPDDARDLLTEIRVGIVTFLPNAAHLEALPTKMFEYLAAGIPVIASDFPLWRHLLEPYDCAYFVDPTSGEQIARAIAFYADNPDHLERQSRNAARASRDAFSWTSEERALLSTYRRIGIEPSLSPTRS